MNTNVASAIQKQCDGDPDIIALMAKTYGLGPGLSEAGAAILSSTDPSTSEEDWLNPEYFSREDYPTNDWQT